jgi:hypothetical protein
LEAGAVINNVTELERGFVLSMAVSTGASLLVLAPRGSDLALVSFEMAELINRVGHAITPDSRATCSRTDIASAAMSPRSTRRLLAGPPSVSSSLWPPAPPMPRARIRPRSRLVWSRP